MAEESVPLTISQGQKNYKTSLNNERESSQFFCNKCQKVQESNVDHKIGTWTLICCGIWCILTFIGGLIPLCCKPCKDVVQYCPECNQKVGEVPFSPC
ncbi:unnamed protein product [Paramecium primaurelia]|uniref:LITAF domain-containing protein n=1 Tax=Paramecium primaurelia TaxID=5886 RepID=A0A8S1K330_PARPR|nr:unnamed protein product [Paramecium primaurelia]